MSTQQPNLETIISLCKRRGFIYPSAEIYGGLNGVYDIGHLGTLMKQNIRAAWLRSLKKVSPSILLFEGALLGPSAVWQASGHVSNFHDPMVDCTNCKYRYRADDIDLSKACPHCGKKAWTDIRQFNMMFQTQLGAATESSSIAYLRPETAQSIFINFKNVLSTNRIKLPFGIAQIGKAFRNEITPKQFLFRMREFEQMEMEWFCKESDVAFWFDKWKSARKDFYMSLGINPDRIRLRNHASDELAHYSTQCTDVEYHFPFGWKELEGIADRGSFDLGNHSTHSGKDLGVFDEETKTTLIPHVVETSVGVDRLFLTLFFDAYCQEDIDGESRIILKFHPTIAPIKAAILPLTKALNEGAQKLHQTIIDQVDFPVEFDDSGSIGKRYRRYDEIGTPVCFTYDFDTLTDGCVTVRNRDTLQQERIRIDLVVPYLRNLVHGASL
jgi:glycyl-tRNA synthetase